MPGLQEKFIFLIVCPLYMILFDWSDNGRKKQGKKRSVRIKLYILKQE